MTNIKFEYKKMHKNTKEDLVIAQDFARSAWMKYLTARTEGYAKKWMESYQTWTRIANMIEKELLSSEKDGVELDCVELTPNCVPLKRERLPLEQIELFPEV